MALRDLMDHAKRQRGQEEESFADLIPDVLPLKLLNNRVFVKKPSERLPQKPSSFEPPSYIACDDVDRLDAPQSYLKANCDKNLLRKLRRGFYRIEDHIDLHGYNRFEAQEALSCFLSTTSATCVLVIHGCGLTPKGRPILKTITRAWLMQQEYVLAFCQTKPKDGGEGALLVLLKSGVKG